MEKREIGWQMVDSPVNFHKNIASADSVTVAVSGWQGLSASWKHEIEPHALYRSYLSSTFNINTFNTNFNTNSFSCSPELILLL